MRTIARAVALLTILCGAWALSAAPSEFYLSLLRRGISEYDAGRFQPAATALRLAAFGFVDSVDQYETAYVYLTLANDRLGHRDDANEAAHRVVAADRVERHYASLALPQPVRVAFEETAGKLLSAADLAALRSGAPPAVTASGNAAKSSPPRVETRTIPAPEIEPPRVTKTTTTTTTTTTAPAKQQEPKPDPNKARKPAPAPPKPAATKPAPVTTQPAQTSQTSSATVDIPTRLTAANRALDAGQLADARRMYRELLDVRALARDTMLRIAEGLYRSRDFAGALQAFDRLAPLRSGEEPYHYYIAVASFETGHFDAAKRELDAALPYIEVTPDVASYRTKIQAAVD